MNSSMPDLSAMSVGSTYDAVTAEDIGSLRVSVPAFVEQRAIADYLDRETARIDALIEKKRRMLGLLQERRQTLITAAVTGKLEIPGLAPRGDRVSAMTSFKRVAVMRAGGTPSVDDPSMWAEDGTPWVTIGDMTRNHHVALTERAVSDAGMRSKRLVVGKPGTILFAMYASLGATAVLDVQASWNQAILGIDVIPHLADSRFARYWLQHLRRDLEALARSNTQDNLNAEQVGNFPFPTIPVRTQRAIADFLDQETARIDALIETIDRQIDLLTEHRQALITAAITGELDVPGVAA
jgi:type I restriction enzyme S subunit